MLQLVEKNNNDTNKYESAIDAINAAAKRYKVKIQIEIRPFKKVVTNSTNKWTITTMGKIFIDPDFVQAVRQAIVFIYNAHNDIRIE